MRITLDKRNGTLETDKIDMALLEAARAMPGRKRWDSSKPPKLLFEPSEANISYLRETFPGAEWTDNTTVLAQVDALMASVATFHDRFVPPRPEMPKDWKFKSKPFDHQLRAFLMSRAAEYYALFMEQGTGKTKVIWDTAGWLWSQGLIDGMLVVGPNGVHTQWVEEQMPVHLPDFVETFTCIWKVDKLTDELFQPTHKLRVFTINYEGITRGGGEDICQRFLNSGRMLMVVDESHRIKSPSANVTKAVLRMRRNTAYRRLLTGTPVAKGLEDKYSQYEFLSPFILGHNTFTSFKKAYCVEIGGIIRDYRNLEQFRARITPHTFRVLKRDALDLPEKIGGIDHPAGPLKRYVELTPEQRHHYDLLRRELWTQLSDGTLIETPLAVQKLIRLQQVLCGHLPRDDGTLEILPNNRPKVAQEIVEEVQGKVCIWARFTHDIDLLVATFGKARALPYYGPNKKDHDKNKALFRDPSSPYDILVLNQASGGTGLDGLQDVASTNIYYSNSFNALDRWQSEDRTHRIGTRFPVTYYDLVARSTVDLAFLSNIRRKRNISDLALAELEIMLRDVES